MGCKLNNLVRGCHFKLIIFKAFTVKTDNHY